MASITSVEIWSAQNHRRSATYSDNAPHLNAIERLWGVMHREVTHDRFYESFDLFARAIDDFFRRRLTHKWRSWRDTITDNFRVVSHQEFRVLR